MIVELPISKSIANRLLILQAMHGDPLMEVTSLMPQDVVLLKTALDRLRLKDRFAERPLRCKTVLRTEGLLTLNVENAGTAFRFLTAYCAQLVGCEVVLDGCERMRQRPIGPLVEALRTMGADIEYVGQEGFPPLHIRGRHLNKQPQCVDTTISSQFASALELIGVPCDAPASPYLTMTRTLIQNYNSSISPSGELYTLHSTLYTKERDWSSAAFWYEFVALYGGEITLEGLSLDSIQGDRVVATLFEPLGVCTQETPTGITIHNSHVSGVQSTLHNSHASGAQSTIDFSSCPDLYPAIAVTCRQLGVDLHATGIENLRYKESNRIEAVQTLLATPKGQCVTTAHDHRIAMAAMVAGFAVDDEQCIDKSYPQFTAQLCKLLSHAKA